MPGYTFEITDGPDQGRTFELEVGVTLLGRRDTPAEDDPPGSRRWVLTDPAVSRTHARIDWSGEGAPVLVHLSSTNATLLEGRIVTGQSIDEGQSLADGHQLRMGQTGIVVKMRREERQWCLVDQLGQENVFLTSGTASTVGCIEVSWTGPIVEAALKSENGEAYVLRSIENQFWTTSLRPGRTVSLQTSDIIRTDTHKYVLELRTNS